MKKQHMGISYTVLQNSNGQYEIVIGKAHYIVEDAELVSLVAQQVIESGEF